MTTPNMRLAGDSNKALPRRFKFTVRSLAAILPPSDPTGRLWVYDAETPGLALLVMASGKRSFYLCRRIHGKAERVRLGGRELTIDQARDEVDRLNGMVVKGENPAEQRRLRQKAATIGELWKSYRDEHLKVRCTAQTLVSDESRYSTCLAGWASRKVVSITDADVRQLHNKLGLERGHTTANRAVQLIRRMFNFARLPNPAGKSAVDMFAESSRARFLAPDELPKLFAALDDEKTNPLIRDFVYLCLWTGARRSAVQAMHRDEINLVAGTWTIPASKSKSGEAVVVPLAAPAVEIIRRRMGNESGYILASHGKSGHLEEPKAAWKDLLKRAGLKDLHIHDLRRTLGSWQAGLGASLPIIGRSLGHKSTAATMIYSRLDLAPVRQSVAAAVEAMQTAGKAVGK